MSIASSPWKTNFFPINERDMTIFGSSTTSLLTSSLCGAVVMIQVTQGNLQADVDDVTDTTSLGPVPFSSSPVFVFHSTRDPVFWHALRYTWRNKNMTSVLLNFFCFTNLIASCPGHMWFTKVTTVFFKCTSRWTPFAWSSKLKRACEM